ncbi:hypothetical protein ABZ820_33325 [Streptomyces diacarni]|uniref:hypothetical protein n=1 Tax=Streptomyces diacarni TaxID=2800381 RepID=UPI0033C0910E
MAKKAYNVQSASFEYDVSKDIIRAAIKRGDLDARYPSSRPIISAEELERWYDSLPSEAPKQ